MNWCESAWNPATLSAEFTAMIVQSLVELILLAPEDEQRKLMAEALAQFGQIYLTRLRLRPTRRVDRPVVLKGSVRGRPC